ncbi:MAG: DUF4338 domain-containing protein [Desulfobacterales bacterium]|nr:MAG: DUF4338 domain-containing protein [Desulfobacterales bacterium]
MEFITKYQGKKITANDIEFIKNLISKNPHTSRRQLSKKLCELWNWRQGNGHLKDMVCRSLLLHLNRSGYITLPPIKFRPNNPLANRKKPDNIAIDTTPIIQIPKNKEIEICQVRRTPSENLFNSLIDQYHYLGYVYPIGEYLKYMFFIDDRPVGCITFSSAVRHIKCRDEFIGWSKTQRESNLHLIAYNTRFLILPWVSIYCLASQLLSKVIKRISDDWTTYFNHPVYYLETFVDTQRFVGTCYKASNWQYLGKTTGRGKNDHTNKQNRSLKAVWGYPLVDNFRELLKK